MSTESGVGVSNEHVLQYAADRDYYVEFAEVVRSILRQAMEDDQVRFLDVQCRAKTVESFKEKASRLGDDGVSLKYSEPIRQLKDLSACRVIVFFPRTLEAVEKVVQREFQVVERIDHAASAADEGRLGYLSVHYVCTLKEPRCDLPEYRRFEKTPVEIQVRTVMQHAWAEIEHDIQYKSSYSVPQELARRFITLAGLLEVADREFQSIQDRDRDLRKEATASIDSGHLRGLELTAASLKSYLDKQYGPDGRMSAWSYEFAAKMARQLGFGTIDELDRVISGYDGDRVSRIVCGSRAGQLSRFEYVLLAAMPTDFRAKHPWVSLGWFAKWAAEQSEKLTQEGVMPFVIAG